MRLVLLLLALIYTVNANDNRLREGMKVYGKEMLAENFICTAHNFEIETPELEKTTARLNTAIIGLSSDKVNFSMLHFVLSSCFDSYFLSIGNYYATFDKDSYSWFMRYLVNVGSMEERNYVFESATSRVDQDEICAKGTIMNTKEQKIASFRLKVVREDNMYKIKQLSEYREV